MIRKMGNVLAVIGGLFISSFAFAQDGSDSSNWLALGSALAIGFAALGGTFAQGRAADAALSGIARNPSSAEKVFTPMIISLALIEFQAIMGFIIAILLSGKM